MNKVYALHKIEYKRLHNIDIACTSNMIYKRKNPNPLNYRN